MVAPGVPQVEAPWRGWQFPEWWPPYVSALVGAIYDPPAGGGDAGLQGAPRPEHAEPGSIFSPYGYASGASLLSELPSEYHEDPYIRDMFNAVGYEVELLRCWFEVILGMFFVDYAVEGAELPDVGVTADLLSWWGAMVRVDRQSLTVDEWRGAIKAQLVDVVTTLAELRSALRLAGMLPSIDDVTVTMVGHEVRATIAGVTASETARRALLVSELRARTPAHLEVADISWLADAPGLATSVSLVSRTAAPPGLVVSWVAPTQTGGLTLMYNVRHRKVGTTAWTTVTDLTTTSYTIPNLKPGDRYEVQIQTTNSAGMSAWTSEVRSTVAPTTPSEDRNFVASGLAGTIITSWDGPADDGGRGVTSHDLEYRLVNTDTWTRIEVATGTSHTITGLTQVGTYEVRVRPTTSIGDGPWTTPVEVEPFQVPSKPDLALVGGIGSVQAIWNTASFGGLQSTGSLLEWRPAGTSGWNTVRLGPGVSRYTISGLGGMTAIEVRVTVSNSLGDSTVSDVKRATSRASAPSAPTSKRLATAAAGHGFDSTWGGPASTGGSAIRGAKVAYRPKGSTGSGTVVDIKNANARSFSISDLDNTSAIYEVRVWFYNAVGDGTPTSWTEVKVARAPAKITTLVGTPRRPLLIDWDWATPNDRGAAISGHRLRWRYKGTTNWNIINVPLGSTTITVANTSRDVEAQVQAVNAEGNGDWSDTVTVPANTLLAAYPFSAVYSGPANLTAPWVVAQTITIPNGATILYGIEGEDSSSFSMQLRRSGTGSIAGGTRTLNYPQGAGGVDGDTARPQQSVIDIATRRNSGSGSATWYLFVLQ